MPIKEGSPYKNPYLLPDYEGIDYKALPLKGLFAFNEQLKLLIVVQMQHTNVV
jgi:hypothetical protein